jgi:O-antigen ligase
LSVSLAQEKAAFHEAEVTDERLLGRERSARLLNRVIFFSLLTLIALVAVPYGTVQVWWEALFECLVFALGALWIVEGMLSRSWLLKGHRIFVPILLIVLYAFIQTLPLLATSVTASGLKLWNAISADPYETRLSVLKLLALCLAGVMLFSYTSNKRRLRALIYTIIGVGIVSAFFGILRQTTQHTQGFLFFPFLSPGSGYGQFINRNHFAFLMEMVLGLILGLIAGQGVRREHILIYLALALPVWTALVLCNSRGGLFSMLAQVLFLALLFSLARAKRDDVQQASEERSLFRRIIHASFFRPVLLAGLMMMIFIGAVWIGGESLTSRLETVSSEIGAEGNQGNEGVRRLEIWRATWALIKDHPLTGVGFNGYWAAIPQYHHASGVSTPQQAHNDYLELLASGGIIGVALVGWFLFLLVRRIRQSLRAPDSLRRATVLGASVGLFGVAVHSMVDFGLHVTINALIFTALIVISIAELRVEDEKPVTVYSPQRTQRALRKDRDGKSGEQL